MQSRFTLRLPVLTVAAAVTVAAAPAHSDAPDAGIISATGNTQVYLNPNGVPVVNIADPNAAGVSHNQYSQFNVDSRGAVLNNGTIDQLSRNSQLAGQTFANANLTSSAKLILNEVTSANRSVLGGYTEVLGQQADVIIANPFGVTCDGCGFLNTPRVTLTTGSASFNGNGGVDGFAVNGGDVLVTGAGLNGTNQNYFDIVTRALKVDGHVNANDLRVTTGANHWNYATGEVSPVGGSAGSGYSVDSTALGGIYANRIRIISTDAGVGVRALGEMAATGADFRIDAAGHVEIGARISSARELQVNTLGGGGIAVIGADASLTAVRDLSLDADAGALSLSGGTLNAGSTLSLRGASLDDTSTATATRSGATVLVSTTGAARIEGATWSAGENLRIEAGSIALDGGSNVSSAGSPGQVRGNTGLSLSASSGDITLHDATVTSASIAALIAQAGGISLETSGSRLQGTEVLLSSRNGLTNAGSVLTSGQLTIERSGAGGTNALTNSGRMQASILQAKVDSIDNRGSGTLLADRLTLSSAGALTNSGQIQATTVSNITAGSIDNRLGGNILTSTAAGGAGDAIVLSGALSNTGTIHSATSLDVTAGGALTNAGNATLAAEGTLNVAAASVSNAGMIDGDTVTLTSQDIENSGRLQTGTLLAIEQRNLAGAGTPRLQNLSSGVILSGGRLTVGTNMLENSGIVQAATGSTIDAVTLNNLTADSRVFLATRSGAGPSVVTLTGDLTNEGAIHGASDVTIGARGISNTTTGGLSSLTRLALTTSNDILNAGSLFAGSLLDVTSAAAFRNTGNAAGTSGTVMAGMPGSGVGAMRYNVDTWANTGTVQAEGDIDITTRVFQNDPIGGVPLLSTTVQMINESAARSDCYLFGAGDAMTCFPLGFPAINDPYVHPVLTRIGYLKLHCEPDGVTNCAFNYVWEATYTVDTTLGGPRPIPAQLLAGRDMRITYSGSARNVASIIGADDLTVTRVGGATVFENNDLHESHLVYKQRFSERWGDAGHQFWTPPDKAAYDALTYFDVDNPGTGEGWVAVTDLQQALALGYGSLYSDTVTRQYDAGIYARGSLNLPGVLNRATTVPTQLQTDLPTNTAGAIGTLPFQQASIQGVSLTLPTSPNGFFVATRDPNANYLVETNPLFTSGSAIGSDYLQKLLGYSAETMQKRLGDSNYEDKLIRDQIIAQTGRNILAGYSSETSQVKSLMENAAEQAGGLGLIYGKPLTAAQRAALKEDLVWMEERQVGGRTVLVPVVYLAATTRDSVTHGATIAGRDVKIDGDQLTNEGGTVRAERSLSVNSTGDIANRSGTISGGTVDLKAGGSVINETVANVRGNDGGGRTDIGGTAKIIAKDGLTIDAGKDVTIKGGDVTAGGNAAIAAGGTVTIDSIQDRNATTTSTSSGSSSRSTNDRSVTQIGSNVKSGGNLSITAAKDVNVGASHVEAGGDADVTAGGNVNVLDRQNETYSRESVTTQGSLEVRSTSVGSSSTTIETVKSSSTSVGSTIQSGGNTSVNAGGSANVRGSDLEAGGNLNVNAKEINVTEGRSTTTETQKKSDSFSGVGVYANEDSTGWEAFNEKTTTSKTETDSKARTSTLKAGGDINRNASGTISDVGTRIEAGGNVNDSAKKIDNRAAADTHTTESTYEKERISVGQSIDYGVGEAYNDAQNGSTAGASKTAGGPTAGSNIVYRKETSAESSSSSTAVVGTIKAGGNVNSKSSGTTALEGTVIQSGGSTTIEAGNLDARAAKDTTTSSKTSESVEAKFRGQVDVTGVPGGEVSASYEHSSEGGSSSTARTGSIDSGGNLTIKTQGDTRLEGTQVKAGGDASIDAGGNVILDAARSTGKKDASSMAVSGSVGVSKTSVGGSFNYSESEEHSRKDEAVTGSVSAGGNLNVRSGKDVKIEGADLSAGKDATVKADGKVELKDAVSTSSSESSSFKASGAAEGGRGSKGGRRTKTGDGEQMLGGGGVSADSSSSSSSTVKKTTVTSGGQTKVEGKQGTSTSGAEVKSGTAPQGGTPPK